MHCVLLHSACCWWDAEMHSVCCTPRGQNREKRYDCYKAVALRLGYREREPLPHCVVGTIRCIYPAADGIYVGFKPV